MAKEKKGSGIQQAAGLIRYFDEESEDAIQISRGMIYFACIAFSVTIYLANHGVLHWLADTFWILIIQIQSDLQNQFHH